MSSKSYEYLFKGDKIQSLIRIEGVLESISPLHLGTGNRRPDEHFIPEFETEEPPGIAEIERDYQNLPLVPGSSLRGVVRNYLYQIFSPFGVTIANEPNYDKDDKFRNMDQKNQIEYMKNEASLLEQVFGTPFCESKVEFWDAHIVNPIYEQIFLKKWWQPNLQSYVMRSVAIDPLTGAAAPNKLYAFDVAPKGLKYTFTIIARNLCDVEMGFLLFGLNGFNSPIYPITLGAMGGRGFGRMELKLQNIYQLKQSDLPDWFKMAEESDDAGYELIKNFSIDDINQKRLVKDFKTTFLSLFDEERKK